MLAELAPATGKLAGKLKTLENNLAEAEPPAVQEAVDAALTVFEAAKARHDACAASGKK